jgi:hypothetical protein
MYDLLVALSTPSTVTRKIVTNWVSVVYKNDFKRRLDFNAMVKPEYGYGAYYAAYQAKSLGYESLSLIELGVAGGNGLVALENIAQWLERTFKLKIDVYGFDMGVGMPGTSDYRDLPYIWEKGFFKMDFEKLSRSLKKAKLILGNVEQTIPEFIEKGTHSPIGFISFDLDYYTSTILAMKLLSQNPEFYIPRVYCYFDDCIGDDHELHSEFTGELLAINEFNNSQNDRKLGKINGLRYKRIFDDRWNEKYFVLHLFDHPKYNININPKKNWQLHLTKEKYPNQ